MKRILLALFITWSCCVLSAQGFYGSVIKSENFDNESTFASSWTVNNATADDAVKLKFENPYSQSFSEIDPSNVTSGFIKVQDGDKPMLTITSGDINLTGKSDIAVGFYGKSLFLLQDSNKLWFKLEISKDGGNNWTELFNSKTDSRSGEELGKSWWLYKSFLPADYNGSTIKVRFVADGKEYSGWSNEIYIDNFFVSERHLVDPIIKTISYSTNSSIPTKNGFTAAEPITVDFENGGKNPIASIKMHYQINEGAVVTETYTPATAIATGANSQYTFTTKANLSTFRQDYSIKAWVAMEGDGNMKNNEITGYAQNITTDLPYVPRFLWTEGSTGYIGADEWMPKSENGSIKWEINSKFGVAFWRIKDAKAATDAYLITRPFYCEQGKTYEIKFDAFTNSSTTEAGKLNKLKVYANDKSDITGMTELYKNEAINNSNAINQFARYTAPKTGVHYFIFWCNSPMTADEFRLQNMYIVEAKNVDAGVSALVSPVANKFEYGTNETVSVKVRNFGTSAIAANAVTIKMQLNNGAITAETVTSAIPVASEVTHQFATKINPSDQREAQILKVWTVITSDGNADNDMKEYKLESIVTDAPYLPTEELDFATNWTVEDRNTDSQKFVLTNDFTLKKYAFSYGGYSGYPVTVITKSNDAVYTRPIRLKNGNTYRIAYQTRVDTKEAGKSMPLRLDLYKVDGANKTLVKNLTTMTVDNTVFSIKQTAFEIEADGIYEIAFVVETSESINFKIYVGDFKVSKIFDYDMMAVESLLSGTSISCYNNLPVGLLVKNDGLKSVSSFKIQATSTSLGTKEKVFNVTLASGESKACYFDDNFVFNGTDEELTLSVVLDNDQNADNNNSVTPITYIASGSVPYSCVLNTAMDYLIVDNNRDGYIFKKFTTGAGMSAAKGVEYLGANDVEANDEIVTKCLPLETGKIYSVAFTYAVVKDDDIASLNVSAYNVATANRIEIASLKSIHNFDKSNFMGYFTVPVNGDYIISLKACEMTTSLRLLNNLVVGSATAIPDVEVVAITTPSADAVFTNNETVTASFKNVGTVALASIPFTCDVNGVVYNAIYDSNLDAEDEATIEFTGVNLFTPGDYTIAVKANIPSDATPANNTATKQIKSLPVVDLEMISIDKPKSGSLSATQQVMITVKNNGRGILRDIPVSFTVSDAKTTIIGTISGPLNDGETVQYTFNETVNMYDEKTYNIVATSSIAGDVNAANNTISTSVICSQVPFDAGVTAILSPVDGVLTATEQVKIKVNNYCTVDLFDVPVKATVGTQTITGSVAKIVAGQESEYTFTQTFDLSTHGMHTIKALTMLDNDADNSNDEFSKEVKSYKIDVGVVDILSPVSGENMGIEQIKITVRNFGDVAVSNIPVKYKVATMPQLGTITSEIAPGATVEFTFISTYDFSEAKTYTITAYTEYATDMDNTNDSHSKEVVNTKKKIDVAVMALIAPVTGVLTDSEAVTVTVKNLGEAAIKNIPIECNIDGVIAKEVIASSIAIGAEMNYTFTKKYDMSVTKAYNVKVTLKAVGDENKTNDVLEQVVNNNVGVNDAEGNLQLSVYPNPVKDVLHIDGEYTLLQAYNSAGKLVLTATGEAKVDVSGLTNGVYVIKIFNNNQTGTYKIVK